MTETAIQTIGLSKSFGEIQAVQDLTFEVPAGIVFGFLGPNGSGKTTTVRMLLGILQPDAGEAYVLGHSVRDASAQIRANSGALLEYNGLYDRLTAWQNLAYYAKIFRLTKADRERRIQELLEPVGLWERKNEPIKDWSRGMRQKLSIARAMIHKPRLLFLDEPTAGLDPLASISLREDLQNLVYQERITVFLNTHNLSEAEKLCDRVAVIHNGKLLRVGTLDEVSQTGQNTTVEVTGASFSPTLLAALQAEATVQSASVDGDILTVDLLAGQSFAPYVHLLLEHGVKVEEIRRQQSSLESVFVDLIKERENNDVD